jgi:hypothetical protein
MFCALQWGWRNGEVLSRRQSCAYRFTGSLGAGHAVPVLIPRLTAPLEPCQSLQAISSRRSSNSTLLYPTNHITPETIFHIVTSSQLKMGTREASHAGSWYEDDAGELSSQLDNFLGQVPAALDEHSLPVPGARVIIAP